MQYLLSFAQECEDVILYHMLRDVKEPIRWVDVGANDPIDISVTKLFSNMGGRGLNIEPQRKYIDLLNEDRPDDINIEAGVSNEEGKLSLYGNNALASFDAENQWVKEQEKTTVPVYTLKKICKEHFSEGETIHFLKIDVEGWEKQVLQGMDFELFRPWIVCVESTEPGTDIPCWEQWENLLIQANYIFAGMSGINRYYVSDEQKQRVEAFRTADELKAIYKIIRYGDIAEGLSLLQKKEKTIDTILKAYHSKPMTPLRVVYRAAKKSIKRK